VRGRLIASLLSGAMLLLGTIGCAPAGDPNPGAIVHREKSMYRDIIVLDTDTHRCMSFARRYGLQSCIRKDAPSLLAIPYTRAVFAGLLANPQARRVLVIGLGGGTIPAAMRRIDPTIDIDVIELDPAVVDVAKRYFGYREDARLRTFTGDGRVFVRRQARVGVRYDLIVIDAYERVYVPEHLMSREFIAEVKSLLARGGVVASNTFAHGPLAPYEAVTYQSVFGEIRIVDMSMGNRIILAGRDGLPPAATIQANAERLTRRFETVGIVMDELESRPQPTIEGYRPLTDQYAPANLLFGE
jgi:spermidine synthase